MRSVANNRTFKSIAPLVLVGALTVTLVGGPATADRGGATTPEWGGQTDAVVPDAATVRVAARTAPVLDHDPRDAKRTDAAARRTDTNVIDVAFVYPAALPAQPDVGGVEGLRQKFNAAIAEANTSYTNSGINVQLRNVGDRQVAAATGTDAMAMLDNLVNLNDGVYDEARKLREETHADLVSLWASGSVPLGVACGSGMLGGGKAQDSEVAAWSMVFYTACVDKYTVFPHEIGHNLSGDHDVAAGSPAAGSKPYARGYTDPAHQFITVMSYYDACLRVQATCVRRPFYSSPTARTPEGYPLGNAGTDNTRAISEQAPLVANYRQSQIYSAAPTITGRANVGSTLRVNTPGWAPGNLDFTYQWYADGAPINGATKPTLRLRRAQRGTAITVAATGSAPYYTAVTASSTATTGVGKRLFARTHRPTIRGRAKVGRSLRATVKRWKPSKKVRYRFQWFRSTKAVGEGRRYRLTRKDRGKKVFVKVTVRKKGYQTTSRTSKKIRVRR